MARGGVEVAGRLVGEDDRGLRDERPRDRDALLLAPRELGRAVGEPVGEADALGEAVEPPCLGLLAGDREREQHVLLSRQHREQVEELEDEADVLAPQFRQIVVAELRDLRAGDRDVAGGRLVEPGEDVHQRRLARAGRPHHGRHLARLDLDRDATQGIDGVVALAVAARELTRDDDRRSLSVLHDHVLLVGFPCSMPDPRGPDSGGNRTVTPTGGVRASGGSPP